jgi:outer membrane biosynthesis protein TonB/CheY-like chemotaxis protein
MPSWLRRRRKSQNSPAAETLIRVCVVSRDPALVEEVHKDLMVGFSTRDGYDFEGGHPDFRQYCDVLFVDLRAAGLQKEVSGVGAQEGLAFIDEIRASVSHPPIVVLCDADAPDFCREVMRRGAYDMLTAPLKMPQLRLALQRAYEFRLAETKLENFLTEQTVVKESPRKVRSRKVRPLASPVRAAVVAPRPARRVRPHAAPSRLAVGFVLGCVLFFAGLVAVRTILTGMGDALASAGFAADSGGAPGATAAAPGTESGTFAARRVWPLTATADFSHGGFDSASPRRRFRPDAELAARPHSSLPGYEPASLIERVSPRYSADARARHLQGTVQIRALIGADGVPRGLARLSGDPTLAQIAIDAIALWRYAPASLDGDPVESEAIIPVDFQLPD